MEYYSQKMQINIIFFAQSTKHKAQSFFAEPQTRSQIAHSKPFKLCDANEFAFLKTIKFFIISLVLAPFFDSLQSKYLIFNDSILKSSRK